MWEKFSNRNSFFFFFKRGKKREKKMCVTEFCQFVMISVIFLRLFFGRSHSKKRNWLYIRAFRVEERLVPSQVKGETGGFSSPLYCSVNNKFGAIARSSAKDFLDPLWGRILCATLESWRSPFEDKDYCDSEDWNFLIHKAIPNNKSSVLYPTKKKKKALSIKFFFPEKGRKEFPFLFFLTPRASSTTN